MKKFIPILMSLAVIGMILPMPTASACANNNVTQQDIQHFLQRINDIYSQGYSSGQITMSNIKEAAVLCGMCTTTQEDGSIGIGKIVNENSYIIVLGGTELNKNENNGIKEDIQSAFNCSNKYLESAISIIQSKIPKDATLYIYGYSLGGMILQQILANKMIKQNYKINAAVAIGSPIITIKRPSIVFIEDTTDIVPKCSPLSLFSQRFIKHYDNHIVRTSEAKTFIGAHALGYIDSPVWNDVDICGIINGTNTLTVDMDNFMTYFC